MEEWEKILLETCKTAHREQYRKDGVTPYWYHPCRVARMAKEYTDDKVVIAVAYFHDIPEDTYMSIDDAVHLASRICMFNPIERAKFRITLQALTKDTNLSPRRARVMDHAYRVLYSGEEAILLKILDRIDNLSELQGMDDEFIRLYVEESKFLLSTLRDKAQYMHPKTASQMEETLVTQLEASIANAETYVKGCE